MRQLKQLIIASAVAASAISTSAGAATYDDTINDVLISGAACRASSGANEAKLYHLPGMTTVKSNYAEVRVYCPIARRNLDVYDVELNNTENMRDVKLNGVLVYVNRPAANIECRLHGKDSTTGSVQYTAWTQPFSFQNLIWMNIVVDWDSYSWGLQCDVGANESILSIYSPVTYVTN
jgi:hypothetical protein